mmetsp:Transcript_30698/g.74122  ORF Transcript_30698/g.74122 Transcript_30698/m.74122 type:complete len:428 (-) Transcript_30698:194-1477(-)
MTLVDTNAAARPPRTATIGDCVELDEESPTGMLDSEGRVGFIDQLNADGRRDIRRPLGSWKLQGENFRTPANSFDESIGHMMARGSLPSAVERPSILCPSHRPGTRAADAAPPQSQAQPATLGLTDTHDTIVPLCVACGKVGDGLKTSNACDMVKYCGADCQKASRLEHKEECEKRAAELFDEKLFKDPPPQEDCPICFLPMPLNEAQTHYQACCGKILCGGCMRAVPYGRNGVTQCPFCRKDAPLTEKEQHRRLMIRMNANDPEAFTIIGFRYQDGLYGLAKDSNKAFEMWSKAAELGSNSGCIKVGDSYHQGLGVQEDRKKAIHYYQVAAMRGSAVTRDDLGNMDFQDGNVERAMKHWMIAARAGHDGSLDRIKQGYLDGHVTKDDFANALRAHQNSVSEMKSDHRDRALQYLMLEALEQKLAGL